MKLSFVIPAHNEEDLIGKCLDSILRELKAKPYEAEIIVVNNASTDRTKEIAKSYRGVKVVDEPRKGIVWARARGLKESTGDLIANLDADTMLTPGWTERVFSEFSKNPNLVCLSGPHFYYDLKPFFRSLTKTFYLIGYVAYLINRFVLKTGSLVQGGNFVCRRSALLRAGGYNLSIEFYGEDTDIARRLHPLGDVKFTFELPIYVSGRRLAKEGIFTSAGRYALNYLWVTFLKRPLSKSSVDVRPKGAMKLLTYQPYDPKREFLFGAAILGTLLTLLLGVGLITYYLATF